MKTLFITALLALSATFGSYAGPIDLEKAKFSTGDKAEWADPSFDDSSWRDIDIATVWDYQGVPNSNQFGWYRFHLPLTKEMLNESDLKEYILFKLGKIDDVDQTYFNGKLIGSTGSIPENGKKYISRFNDDRNYLVNIKDVKVNWDGDNVLAVRCYSGGHPGGMFGGNASVSIPDAVDGVNISFAQPQFDKESSWSAVLTNTFNKSVSGVLTADVTDMETGKSLLKITKKVKIPAHKSYTLTQPYDKDKCLVVKTVFTEKGGKSITASYTPKYILTPAAPLTPRFNTPAVYGVRPGSPIHFRFGVSGEKPMEITSANLPEGLSLNAANGALSGKLDRRGDYKFTVTARNAHGEAKQEFTIKVGDKIALTPPMGWNSWNVWGLSVTQDKVISSAQALIDKGLADYGYAYINVDDAWEAPARNADGTIAVNEKFPDMKGLGDWLHSEGLKFGIYSSPGDYTCGGYLGSLDHEKQDAESYNEWGVDYLKYDWCGYTNKHVHEADRGTVASYVRPYMLMEEYLRAQPRDIFYSLCQYGMADVWKWGEFVDANSWRTTGDIVDTWESVLDIGFNRQAELYPYAKSGHWNDPDMLVVGKVGWSNNLRDSRLTPDEQYSHITLWSLLASNMLIGCDLAQLDDFTIGLLCNNEVNAVNQDVLGQQARRDIVDGDIQIWTRPLADGSRAIGIFNLGSEPANVDLNKYAKRLGLASGAALRDLWRQSDIPAGQNQFLVPTHGVRFIKAK